MEHGLAACVIDVQVEIAHAQSDPQFTVMLVRCHQYILLMILCQVVGEP